MTSAVRDEFESPAMSPQFLAESLSNFSYATLAVKRFVECAICYVRGLSVDRKTQLKMWHNDFLFLMM